MKFSIIIGFLASLLLLSLYGTIMLFFSGWDAMTSQFINLWYLMVPLAVGFGIQVALAVRLRTLHAASAGGASASVAMLACCAHHATDVLPVLGLSAASTFLAAYQKQILVISLFINVLGIVVLANKTK